MPGQIRAVPGTNTIYAARQATLFHEDNTELWTCKWSYEKRGSKTRDYWWTWKDGYWPARSGFFTDPGAQHIHMRSNDLGLGIGSFESDSSRSQGNQSLKYIMGQCLDSVAAPVPNAIVQGFLTSDDSFQRETISDDQGMYEVGTDKAGQAHYLVAYKAGSPDIAGTTVNTLTPTNRDGS